MKFIKQQMLITTICNTDITDKNEIGHIMDALYKNRLDFSVSFFKNKTESTPLSYDKARVTAINDDNVDLMIISKDYCVSYKSINFDNFVLIKIIDDNDMIYIKNDDVTRFDMIETEDKFD